jgi:hypothetical protein
MTCVRCEVIRAKAIAMGMAGLRKSGEQIVAELRGRYGQAYRLDGRRVVREAAGDQILIIEVRR